MERSTEIIYMTINRIPKIEKLSDKEPDDNSPNKTDRKDLKTIAKLVIEGRYSISYIPEGIYADLRESEQKT